MPDLISTLRFHRGEEHAISETDLCRQLNISPRDLRDLRMSLEEEYPIASSPRGYYWCSCYDDYTASMRWRMARLRAEARAYSRMRRCRNSHYPSEQLRLM